MLKSRRRRNMSRRADRPLGRTYPLKWVVAGLVAVGALLIGGPWLVLWIVDGSTPSTLTLPAADGVAKGPLQPGPVTGTWTVVAGSQAGYRVEELLFGASHTAVGRTSKVTGGMVISGTEVTAADFSVDVASVTSDQGARDYQFRQFIMDAADYPKATFRLTEPISLGSVPDVGRIVKVPATGALTMRGVSRSVSFTLSAERLSSTQIDVNAEIPVTFARWHIPNPSFAVAKVGDTGTVEVLLDMALTGADGRPVAPVPAPSSTTTVFTPGQF
jgi:polyisoprenoid-binding protein YceI